MIAVCLDYFAFYHQSPRGTHYTDHGRINHKRMKIEGFIPYAIPCINRNNFELGERKKEYLRWYGWGKQVTSD